MRRPICRRASRPDAWLPRRRGWKHRRCRQQLRQGQPRDPERETRKLFPPLLPAQSKTVPDHRYVGCRRSQHSRTRPRPRHPHRHPALSGLARQRGGGRAGNIMSYWRDDLVSPFVLGCSFSFEEPPLDEGLPIRHIEHKVRVPMFPHQHRLPSVRSVRRTPWSYRCDRSSRRMRSAKCKITSRFPSVHGAPVHLGLPDIDRHRRHHKTRLRRSGASRSRRDPGVLGMWRDAAGGDRQPQAAVRDHARARPHAGDGSEEQAIGCGACGQRLPFLGGFTQPFAVSSIASRSTGDFAMTITRRNVLLGATAVAPLAPVAGRAQTPEVVIGVIYPFSGANAQQGVDAQKAPETALEIINKDYDFDLTAGQGRRLARPRRRQESALNIRRSPIRSAKGPRRSRTPHHPGKKVCAVIGTYQSAVAVTVSQISASATRSRSSRQTIPRPACIAEASNSISAPRPMTRCIRQRCSTSSMR